MTRLNQAGSKPMDVRSTVSRGFSCFLDRGIEFVARCKKIMEWAIAAGWTAFTVFPNKVYT